jgi:hypothetical protein
MDFNDTPEQAKFRAKCKEWLDANAELKDTGKRLNVESNLKDLITKAKAWQKRNMRLDGQCCIGQKSMAASMLHL